MNQLEQLNLNVDGLYHAVKEHKKFFAAIFSFVEKLHNQLLNNVAEVRKEEILFLAEKIETFFADYRSSPGTLYIPPNETSQSDKVVKEIYKLATIIASLPDEEFESLKPAKVSRAKELPEKKQQCVFIGHGRSKLWATVQVFLNNDLKLKTVCYESESRVGESIIPILEKMLIEATYAILVLTAEDETGDGGKRARQNVIHEAGLFQGRLGFDKAVLLVQRGLESFSNVDGLQYIPFTDNNIEEAFYQLQRALKAKGIIT